MYVLIIIVVIIIIIIDNALFKGAPRHPDISTIGSQSIFSELKINNLNDTSNIEYCQRAGIQWPLLKFKGLFEIVVGEVFVGSPYHISEEVDTCLTNMTTI